MVQWTGVLIPISKQKRRWRNFILKTTTDRRVRIVFFTIVSLYCIGSAYLSIEDFYNNGFSGKTFLRCVIQTVGIPVLIYWAWDAYKQVMRAKK